MIWLNLLTLHIYIHISGQLPDYFIQKNTHLLFSLLFWGLICKENYIGAIKSMKGWDIGANLNIKHGEHPDY